MGAREEEGGGGFRGISGMGYLCDTLGYLEHPMIFAYDIYAFIYFL